MRAHSFRENSLIVYFEEMVFFPLPLLEKREITAESVICFASP
ncbi:hypothetical protein TNIN_444511, partial [Trichonephila inaurata madagascariensis]